MQLSASDLELIRLRPQSSNLSLSIFQPQTVLACQINAGTGTVARGDRVIPFDSVTSGSYLSVEPGMTLLVGTSAGSRNLGRIRIKSITATHITVSENSHIFWVDLAHLTVLRYFEMWPVYPRIIPDPADDEDVIFYKDYDIPYTDENSVLGVFPCAGNHRAFWAGEQTYWSASGTAHMVSGTSLTYDWAFEGGSSITGSSSQTPGNVTYNTPGHYVTRLIVTGDNGSSDTTYRYVSVYNRPENSANNNPIKKWEVQSISGSRGEGGSRASIKVTDEILDIHDGDVVVIFADDWYGGNNISLGGNAIGNPKIFFVGHILSDSIRYNYQSSYTEFEVGNISEVMKATETYAISLETSINPTKWFQMLNLDGRRGIYHFLKWHSTAMFLADFEFVGTDQPVQYFDTDRQSLFDAVDNYMRNALLGTMVSDRQGKMWIEVGHTLYTNPALDFPIQMTVDRRDWIGEPLIQERLSDELSFIEVGGVAWSGGVTGTFQPFLSQAPGATPGGKGSPDNIPGLAISGQAQLNTISGNVFADRNTVYPQIEMNMSAGFRNMDIAPIMATRVNVDNTDTNRNIDIHARYFVEGMDWTMDVQNQVLLPSVNFHALANGYDGETITIPDLPDDGGFGDGDGHGTGLPVFTPIVSSLSPTYTWIINIPAIGGTPGPFLNLNHTAMTINAYCVGGTSVAFNLEVRSVIGTPGTPISGSDIVATPTGVVGGIANPILPIGNWLWLEITGVVGTVSKFVVTLGVM